MSPGEIYMADLGEATRHPVIVVSREELNRGDRVVAVLCTSQKFAIRSTLAHCVPFPWPVRLCQRLRRAV